MIPWHLHEEVFQESSTGINLQGRTRIHWRESVCQLVWELLGVPWQNYRMSLWRGRSLLCLDCCRCDSPVPVRGLTRTRAAGLERRGCLLRRAQVCFGVSLMLVRPPKQMWRQRWLSYVWQLDGVYWNMVKRWWGGWQLWHMGDAVVRCL